MDCADCADGIDDADCSFSNRRARKTKAQEVVQPIVVKVRGFLAELADYSPDDSKLQAIWGSLTTSLTLEAEVQIPDFFGRLERDLDYVVYSCSIIEALGTNIQSHFEFSQSFLSFDFSSCYTRLSYLQHFIKQLSLFINSKY
jgi:hypothetical protein